MMLTTVSEGPDQRACLFRICRTLAFHIYRIYPKYSDRLAITNSIEPNRTPQNVASNQDLHCLSII